jgi:tellurite methyltransferase
VVVCIQDTGDKVQMLNQAIHFEKELSRLTDKKFTYTFEDSDNGHKSETDYRMVVVEK